MKIFLEKTLGSDQSDKPDKSNQTLTLRESAEILGVTSETLLKWNENDILKAGISANGEIEYSKDQIDQFLQINDRKQSKTNRERSLQENSHRNKTSNSGILGKLLEWLGYKFYEDEYIKDYLKSQVRESLTYTVHPPTKRAVSISFTVILILSISLFTQQHRVKTLIESFQKTSLNPESSSKVLAAETSRLVLSGTVIFQTPIIGKEDSNFEKDLFVGGEGIFTGNITAPNIVYSVRGGDHVNITEEETQSPIINVDLSGTVSTIQGQSGDITLLPGTDISIDGLTINDISTLTSVSSRGHCDGCITDADVVNTITIDAGGQIAGEAIKSGLVSPTVGGTGLGTYIQGDMLYSSEANKLDRLPIGTIGQFLTVGTSGDPAWDNVGSFAVAVVKKDDVVISPLTNTLNFDGGDFDPTVAPVGQVNIQLSSILTSVVGVANNFNVGGDTLSFSGNGNVMSSGSGSITLDSGSTGSVNIGPGNDSKTINIGTGSAGNIINIATDDNTADIINIASTLDTTTINGSVTANNLSANNVNITGGVINNTPIGNITPTTASFTDLTSSGNSTLSSGADAMTLIGNATGSLSIISTGLNVTTNGGITIPNTQTLTIGTISLNASGSGNLTSGANLVGVYDELVNSSSNVLQQVLKDLDASITSAGVSPFTIDADPIYGDFIRPTTLTHDFILGGGGTPDTSMLFFNSSTGELAIGTNESLNGSLTFYSAGSAVNDPKITASDSGDLLIENSNVGIGTAPIDVDADNNLFKLEVAGSIGPNQDSLYDLGSPTRQYRNLYLAGQTTSGGNITIANDAPSITFVETDNSNYQFSLNTDNQQFVIRNNTNGTDDIVASSSGDIILAGGVSSTGCTIENSTGDLACTGNITGSNTGTVGYWSRDNATSTLRTATDWDNMTLGGLLTATGGATIAGTTNINTSGSSATNIGTGSYSGNLTLGNAAANVVITDANWNISGAGAANFTSIGAATPGTGAFTDLSSTGTTNIATGAGSATTIGNATGTFQLISNALDISTAGVISGATGISSSGIINFSTLDPSRVVFTDASENLTSTGTVGVNQGGTGVTTFGGANTLLYTSAADTLAWVTNGTTGQYLRATTNGAPAFANILSSEITNNDFLVRVPAATANNTVAPTANGVVSMTLTGTTGTGTPHILDINDSTSNTRSYFDSTGALNTVRAITAPTSGNTINGIVINSGALSSVSSIDTISVSGVSLGFAGAGAISAGGSSNLTLDAGGSGLVQIGGTSTGNVELAGGSSNTGCTVENSTGNMICTGTVTANGVVLTNLWQRSDTTLSPINAGDAVNTSGNIYTSGTGTITSAGLLTGQAGLTVSGGDVTLNDSSNYNTSIGTGTSPGIITIGNATVSNLILNDANWNVSGAGAANFTSIGAATPGTGVFTSLSSTGITSLGNGTSTVSINSSSWDITSGGELLGITGYSQGSGNFTVNGSGSISLGTGTGNVTIGNSTGSLTLGGFLTDKGILFTNGSGVVSQTLQGATNTVLHGNASGTPFFSAVNLSSDVTGTLPVTSGGTGNNSLILNGVLIGNDTSAITTATGSAYQVLRIPSGGGAPSFDAVNLSQSAAVTGTLGITNGGTGGTNTPTAGAIAYGNGSIYAFSGAGTTGQALLSGGTGSPTWTIGTLTLGQNLITAGSSALTLTTGGSATNATLPTGNITLADLESTQIFTGNKTFTPSGTNDITFNVDSDSIFSRIFSSLTDLTYGSNYLITNTASSGQARIIGENISLVGTGNATGNNTLTGINFSNVTAQTNNYFNGITFGTGFTNFLTSPSINISGAGAITGATGISTTTLSTTGTVNIANLSSTAGSSICVDASDNLIKCGAGSGSSTLQSAYDLGNTITTSDNRDISFILADTTTDSKFLITNQATASAIVINDINAATNTLISLQTNGTTNIAFDENGVIRLAGNNTADITTLTPGNTLTIQPIINSNNTGIGDNLILKGANESGTTTATGGAVLISGGSATGVSGIRTGGNVNIEAGFGASSNGIINIATNNTAYLTLGAAGIPIKIPGLGSAAGSSLCRDPVTNDIVVCTAGSSSSTLQSSYDQGNTILTTDNRNINFILGDTTIDSYFNVENQGTASAMIINDTNTAINTLIDIQSGGLSKMTINELGTVITSGNIVATGSATITSAGILTVLSGGASISGGINNNSWGISNTGTISGALDITASGTIQGATLNATSDIVMADPSSWPQGSTALCRNSNGQISFCTSNPANVTLQEAYNAGNTIAATDTEGDIDFTLSSGNSAQFILTNEGTATAFTINDTNAELNTSLAIQSGGSTNFSVNELGAINTLGPISQIYSTNTSGNAYLLNLTNTNTSGSPVTTNAISLVLTSAVNPNSTNIMNGINFPAAVNNNANIINGVNFESATGFNYFFSTPTINISSSGAITGATGLTLTSGDITTSGNIYTSGSGTITSAGLLTGNGGLTISGDTNINASGSANINIGTGTYSGNLSLGNISANLSLTDANWNISGAGAANFTSIGAATPGTGAFTDLSSTGTTNIATGAGSATTIGNATGTFQLISNALDISTAGVISGATGISSSGIINFSTLDPSRVVFTDASENLTSTGTVGVNQGGTGVTTFGGANTLLYTSAADTLAWVTNGTTGQYLRATTNGAPAFANILSSEITNNDFLVRVPAATANNTVAPTANGVVSMTLTGTTGTGTPHILNINDSTSNTRSYFDSTGALNTVRAITAPTSGNTINGIVINSGALSSVSSIDTISVSGVSLGFAGAGAISAGGSSNLTLDAGGSGLVQIGGTSTGNVELAGGSSNTGCTVVNSTGDLNCSGTITSNGIALNQYWQRSGTTLSPLYSGDSMTTSGNISATGSGTISSAGLLTSSGGLTVSGDTNINTSGSSATNIGTGSYSGNLTLGNAAANVVITDANWSVNSSGDAAFNSLTTGGGYAGTGVTITSGGNISGKGNLVMDGTINTSTLSGTLLTFSGVNPVISPSTLNTGLTLQANGTGTLTLGETTGVNVIEGTNFSVNANGTISARTTGDTINGLIINSGSLSSVTGYSQGSGNFTVNGTGDVSLGTGSGDVTIGNTTGTFQLASSGGLNVSTTGGLTGVATIDTISVSDTALGFAGAGAISAGGTSNLTLNAGGSGLVQIGGTSTGNVELAGGVSATGCTIYNSTGDLACTGNITGSNTGTVGYWSRDNATSTLRTATDWDNMTLGGLLTATGGATIAGTTNINTSGSSATNIGTGSYSGNLTLGNAAANVVITDANWNISGAGAANFTSIGAATPGTGAFTDLSSTGTTNIATGAGSATTIGNATGTFQLISTGMNVSTAGVITLPGGQATDITTTGATTLKIAPGGAAAMTLGSATTTAINLTTDGTGDAELVLPGQSVSASEILNDTITATQLASTLTFSDGDFIDLSAIDYSTSDLQGLRLPNVNGPLNPISGKGFIAYDTEDNRVVFYNGSAWDTLASGTSASKWTEDSGNNIIYPNNIGRNLSLNPTLASAFSVDYLNNTLRVGSGSTTSATISMYASDGERQFNFNTSDQFQFQAGSGIKNENWRNTVCSREFPC